MLPKIVEVAERHGLEINSRSRGRTEVLCKCPFCQEDSKPGKNRKYYLRLNSQAQVFKCFFCNEGGGVLRFISLLDGTPESELANRYRKRKIIHPAERLTRSQRKWLAQRFGYYREPNWENMKNRDRAYYLRTLDIVWEDWQNLLQLEKQEMYFLLLIGIAVGKFSEYLELIRIREKEIGVSLLNEILNVYSRSKRPDWTEHVESFVQRLSNPRKSFWKTEVGRTG
jgi:hypothetical protein